MRNNLEFEHFLSTLKPTNKNLGFYVDWGKCLKNRDDISICLNHLNFLLGKNKHEMRDCINKLFSEYPKAFSILNILIAVRDKKEVVLDSKNKETSLEIYLKEPKKIYEFIYETGLIEIFCAKKIKDLNDFVFGIEVGFDTNARKNRSGSVMELCVKNLFNKANLNFSEQVNISDFSALSTVFGDDIKRFDFVIFAKTKTYFIECNFYSSGGSKLNEVARAYQEIALKFETFKHYNFVWITDGKGWLNAKNKLREAYKIVETYNLKNIDAFIKKVQNAES